MPLLSLFRLAALVFTAVSCVVIGDTAGKLLAGLGAAPVFIAWSRFVLGACLLIPFCGLSLQELRHLSDWRVAARGALIAAAVICILSGLRTEPIANVFGAFFVGPVVSYILAILFLGERPSRSRSLLLAVGFVGVMLVVKPGFGASFGMGLALAAGVIYGAYLAMTRTVAGLYRPGFLLVAQLLVASALLTPPGLTGPIPDLTAPVAGLVLVSALGSALGNYLLVVANRSAEASLIAPLVYTQLVSATLAGVLVFGDWPDGYALFGLCLIAASGFGSLLAQQKSARADQSYPA